MPDEKTYTRDEAFKMAENRVSHRTVSWDDLPDTNSLWDYIEDGMTASQILDLADEAYKDRFREAADEMGFSDDDIEGMLEI